MKNRKYLTETVPALLKSLNAEMEPSFGIMTAQHMVEHLIWVTKSSTKDFGPPSEELSEGNLKFMKFVKSGADLSHRPSTKTKADLGSLKYATLSEAIDEISTAINRFYNFSADHSFYNPMMGALSFEEMESFHARHYRYHLENQFGLQHPS